MTQTQYSPVGHDSRCLSRVVPCLEHDTHPKLKELALSEILELIAPNGAERKMEQNPFLDDIIDTNIMPALQQLLMLEQARTLAPPSTSAATDASVDAMFLHMGGIPRPNASDGTGAADPATVENVRLLACRVLATIAEDPQHLGEFSKLNFIPTLVALLRTQVEQPVSNSDDVQFEVVRMLVALADSGMRCHRDLAERARTHTSD